MNYFDTKIVFDYICGKNNNIATGYLKKFSTAPRSEKGNNYLPAACTPHPHLAENRKGEITPKRLLLALYTLACIMLHAGRYIQYLTSQFVRHAKNAVKHLRDDIYVINYLIMQPICPYTVLMNRHVSI